MKKLFTLTKPQWKLLAGTISNISQGIVLFSLAAIFVPEVVSLKKDFSRTDGIFYLSDGLFLLIIALIIARKGK